MKKLFVTLFSIFLSISLFAQTIGYIETTESWYKVYDVNAKKISIINKSNGILIGFSSNFYILQNNSDFYSTYEPNGKRINIFSTTAVGTIISVQGDTFVSKKGDWIFIYNKDGRKIYTTIAK